MFTDPATGQKWFAGGTSRKFACPKDAVLVALTHYAMDMPILANIPLIPMKQQVVMIDWADGQAGPLNKLNQYKGMLRALRATKQDVAVACVGGHGRTGTFLAMNAWLMNLPQQANQKPVEYIRKVYCDECVETKVQLELLRDLTGVDETSLYKPVSYSSGYYGGYWQGGYWNSHKGNNNDSVKQFDASTDPETENEMWGYFWGQVYGKAITKYFGYPTGAGKWVTDSAGWYWAWDEDNPKPEYYPSHLDKKSKSKTQYDDFENTTFDPESGYGYPEEEKDTPPTTGQSAQQFLNDYYSGKKAKESL